MTTGVRAPGPEARRKVFRQMEWVFVYAPPLLIVLVAGSTAALAAWLLPVYGLGFWTRWLIAFVMIVGLPLVGYVIRSRIQR